MYQNPIWLSDIVVTPDIDEENTTVAPLNCQFMICTPDKNFTFAAESRAERDAWVVYIEKAVKRFEDRVDGVAPRGPRPLPEKTLKELVNHGFFLKSHNKLGRRYLMRVIRKFISLPLVRTQNIWIVLLKKNSSKLTL